MTIVEEWKDRVAVAEKYYAKNNMNESMDDIRKLTVAQSLKNISNRINEAFANSNPTQRTDMGDFKRFCLNLTTVAVPNLIAYDLVKVYPMPSYVGSIAYTQFVAGSNKGETKQGYVFNDPFRLGKADVNYTSSRVVETLKVATESAALVVNVLWSPVLVTAEGKLEGGKIVKVSDNTEITEYTATKDGKITITSGVTSGDEVKVGYVYDNVVVPQNDLPLLNMQMNHITLEAHARRIAIEYSQMAAYQAKQDYGVDAQAELAKKAVGQLNFEIDTEIVNLLADNAKEDQTLVFSRTQPVGVSKQEHFASFIEKLQAADTVIYNRTGRFSPNYILCAADLIEILIFVPGYKAAPTARRNGPYLAGTVNGMKVFVTPSFSKGEFVVGVNDNEMDATAAVYAPYLMVIPTSLIQTPDGLTGQGFSTMYDLVCLNPDLLVKGRVTV